MLIEKCYKTTFHSADMQLNLLIFLLISVFQAESSKSNQEFFIPSQKLSCKNIKCPPIEDAVCLKVKNLNEKEKKETFVIAVNKCEIQYAKCNPGVEAIEVPMKNCKHDVKKQINRRTRLKREISDEITKYSVYLANGIKKNINKGQKVDDNVDNNQSDDHVNDTDDDHSNNKENQSIHANDDENNNEKQPENYYENQIDDKNNNENDDGNQVDNGYDNENPSADANNDSKEPEDTNDDENVEDNQKQSDNNDDTKEIQDNGDQDHNEDDRGPINEIPLKDYDVDDEKDSNVIADDYDQNVDENVDYYEYKKDCPSVCPARDVMVCGKCKHNIYRTFLSQCHLRIFDCKFPNEKLELVKRYPCMQSSPFLTNLPQAKGKVVEPSYDSVLKFIYCREKGRLNKEDSRCKFDKHK